MAPVTTATNFDEWRTDFELGLSVVHEDELVKLPKLYKDWLSERPVRRFYDTDWSVSGLGIMPEKGIGQQFSTDQLFQGVKKTYTLKTYGLMLLIQKEAWDWDLYGVIRDMTKMLAKSAVDRYNLVAYAIPNFSFSSSDPLFQNYQGEALIKLAHKRLDGGTWKNRPTTNLGLSYLALMQAQIDFRRQVDQRGRFISLEPETLMCAPEQEWIAKTILQSDYRPGDANREKNIAATMGLSIHGKSPYITLTTAFWLMGPKKSYKLAMGLGQEPDFQTEGRPGTRDRLYSSYCSFRLEIYDALGWWASSGDGATSP